MTEVSLRKEVAISFARIEKNQKKLMDLINRQNK